MHNTCTNKRRTAACCHEQYCKVRGCKEPCGNAYYTTTRIQFSIQWPHGPVTNWYFLKERRKENSFLKGKKQNSLTKMPKFKEFVYIYFYFKTVQIQKLIACLKKAIAWWKISSFVCRKSFRKCQSFFKFSSHIWTSVLLSHTSFLRRDQEHNNLPCSHRIIQRGQNWEW